VKSVEVIGAESSSPPALGDERLGEQQRTQVPYGWGAMGQ
jgi:hypothetical protein